MIKVSAHQPNFLPWPGFWHKLLSVDVFVLCAGMQYVHRSYGNRVRMRDDGGWATIPVSGGMKPYTEIEIADVGSVHQIGRRIQHWSQRREFRYGDRLMPIVSYLKQCNQSELCNLNVELIRLVLEILDHHETELIVDTENRLDRSAKSSIADLLSAHGEIYMSGSSAPKYLEREDLSALAEVHLQNLRPGIGDETVLHLIAEEEDPKAAILELGNWVEWTTADRNSH